MLWQRGNDTPEGGTRQVEYNSDGEERRMTKDKAQWLGCLGGRFSSGWDCLRRWLARLGGGGFRGLSRRQ
jgi:hypothetical protein